MSRLLVDAGSIQTNHLCRKGSRLRGLCGLCGVSCFNPAPPHCLVSCKRQNPHNPAENRLPTASANAQKRDILTRILRVAPGKDRARNRGKSFAKYLPAGTNN